MRYRSCPGYVLTILLQFLLGAPINAQTVVLSSGHAHNDYWHCRPLSQAIEAGFMSIEVDVHLLKGGILVNHEAVFTRKGRNLEAMYLQPLFEMTKANNFESVYPNGHKEFFLYIDIKQGCLAIHDTLISQLKRYEQMMTVWESGVKKTGAVSIIIGDCGRRDEWVLAAKRWFYFDAHLDKIDDSLSADFIPRIGSSLHSVTNWSGIGKLPKADEAKIRALVSRAHANGRTIRFWAGTNRPKVWTQLLDLGVDWINVDRLKKFQRFMKKRQERVASLKD